MIRVAAVLAAIAGFVPVSGHRMYYECMGNGSPTVVLDAGSPDSHIVWSGIQPTLARHTRVCAYDRAGLGLSAPAQAGKRTVLTQAHDLLALLHAAHVPGPYVVVGHSWGGLIARVFAHAYPRQTAGLVLVDATTFPYGVPPISRKREGVDTATAQKESNAVTSLGSIPVVVLGSNRAAAVGALREDAGRGSGSLDGQRERARAVQHALHPERAADRTAGCGDRRRRRRRRRRRGRAHASPFAVVRRDLPRRDRSLSMIC